MRTLILFLLTTQLALAQNGMSVELFGIKAFQDKDLNFFDVKLKDYSSQGFGGSVLYTYKLKKINSVLSAGFIGKKLSFEGSTDDGQQLEGSTIKFGFVVGGDYKITGDWKAGLRFVMENNRDHRKFRISTTDLFRYNIELRSSYEVWKDISIAAYYSFGLYPKFPNYLLFNPPQQAGVGLKYDFL